MQVSDYSAKLSYLLFDPFPTKIAGTKRGKLSPIWRSICCRDGLPPTLGLKHFNDSWKAGTLNTRFLPLIGDLFKFDSSRSEFLNGRIDDFKAYYQALHGQRPTSNAARQVGKRLKTAVEIGANEDFGFLASLRIKTHQLGFGTASLSASILSAPSTVDRLSIGLRSCVLELHLRGGQLTSECYRSWGAARSYYVKANEIACEFRGHQSAPKWFIISNELLDRFETPADFASLEDLAPFDILDAELWIYLGDPIDITSILLRFRPVILGSESTKRELSIAQQRVMEALWKSATLRKRRDDRWCCVCSHAIELRAYGDIAND